MQIFKKILILGVSSVSSEKTVKPPSPRPHPHPHVACCFNFSDMCSSYKTAEVIYLHSKVLHIKMKEDSPKPINTLPLSLNQIKIQACSLMLFS